MNHNTKNLHERDKKQEKMSKKGLTFLSPQMSGLDPDKSYMEGMPSNTADLIVKMSQIPPERDDRILKNCLEKALESQPEKCKLEVNNIMMEIRNTLRKKVQEKEDWLSNLDITIQKYDETVKKKIG
ncbi:Hypothetical predicted protein [Pelobates cultripes]|uniref:Uncharacterized protein n=1 Tax=Pelobates cultripes TaxID=61616 RepID=A0AAD1RIK6_PELCU|nr:Hypothetical predicted protein [Pelobates cultripes]